ncbi:flagellar hook-basal body complex protein FliE [Ciceribacter thiooxidans]|uniref:Flagellar hook-basal body complex protein FliE n=1 Tax=Ciceribacter thiooxidans TaxID=1969821 RepID=A0ABV7HYX0_9HYPH|nr:flagellar hook-basal body complex protein FliE [Ciceribacter thiooxidans]MDI6836292.1 flagellar hook-basal body complex protein FliE [Rhizobiaceae bacterium]
MIEKTEDVTSLSRSSGLGFFPGESVTTSTGQAEGVTPGAATGQSFAGVLGSLASDAVNNLKQAEVTSFEGIKGTANTREVVDAVLAAEQSLQTAIALRDKIVTAYLEITKMQI